MIAAIPLYIIVFLSVLVAGSVTPPPDQLLYTFSVIKRGATLGMNQYLSEVGRRQMYMLGTKLRTDMTGFLSDTW